MSGSTNREQDEDSEGSRRLDRCLEPWNVHRYCSLCSCWFLWIPDVWRECPRQPHPQSATWLVCTKDEICPSVISDPLSPPFAGTHLARLYVRFILYLFYICWHKCIHNTGIILWVIWEQSNLSALTKERTACSHSYVFHFLCSCLSIRDS